MTYKTSLDTPAVIITSFITLLFGSIITGVLLFRSEEATASIIIILILALIYFSVFLSRPVDYRLTKDKLIIHRPLIDVKINRMEIKSIRQVEPEQLRWTIRAFGVGGLFGYWGRFTNPKLGSMTWYATRKSKAILIETIHNEKILLTPDKPDELVADYHL